MGLISDFQAIYCTLLFARETNYTKLGVSYRLFSFVSLVWVSCRQSTQKKKVLCGEFGLWISEYEIEQHYLRKIFKLIYLNYIQYRGER